MARGARPPWWIGSKRRFLRRPEIRRLSPVHVSVRVRDGTPKLRTRRFLRLVRETLEVANTKFRFSVIEYSLQGNHLHLIVEAGDTYAVSRAVRGISIRIARRLNAALGTRGVRIADRYFMTVLQTPLQVHLALRYVLNNYRRHAAAWGVLPHRDWVDPFSSAPWFDGWCRVPQRTRDPCPDVGRGIRAGRSILLTRHWKMYGLLEPSFVPGPSRNS